jgi:UDP-N-acetylmuramate dehydrogenase
MFSNISNTKVIKNAPLKDYCTFRIGGNAKYLIQTFDIDALLDVLYACHKHSLHYKIIGNGSNLLFDDLGFNGAIIKHCDNFKQFKNIRLIDIKFY